MARVVSGEWIIAVPGQVKRRGKDHVAVVADFVPEGSAKISEEEFSATSLGLPISEFGADFPVASRSYSPGWGLRLSGIAQGIELA